MGGWLAYTTLKEVEAEAYLGLYKVRDAWY